MREGKLGGLAVLRNLRNMLASGVELGLIRDRLGKGINRALPFRFITAARYAPMLEPEIEAAMLKAIEGMEKLPGRTGLLIDVSGSMNGRLSEKSEVTRVDAAAGLGVLVREVAEHCVVATFSSKAVAVPPRRGLALRDAIHSSQPHGSTNLRSALSALKASPPEIGWQGLDRVIVITDEQSHDGILPPFTKGAYVINVAPYKSGVSNRNGWTHIDGWSEQVIEYIRLLEKE